MSAVERNSYNLAKRFALLPRKGTIAVGATPISWSWIPTLCDPQERQAALDEISRSLECAHRVGARQLSLFSNAIRPGGVVVPAPPLPAESLRAALADPLRRGRGARQARAGRGRGGLHPPASSVAA